MSKRNCTAALQRSLTWCEGTPSHPGIRRRVYFCNKSLIVAYPTLPRDSYGRPTAAILKGNFELVDGAYWQYLDINIDKSTVTSDPQGEAPSQTQLNKATLVHNGVDEEATAAAGWLNNSDNIYIVEDMPGKFRVLGNNRWRTKTTTKQDLGQGTNSASTTIEVEVTDEVAPPFYFGTIETEDGTVSAESAASPQVLITELDVPYGGTAQIDVIPNDENWTFESNQTRVASVNAAGVVTGNSLGRCAISCFYDGTMIGRVSVTVDYMAGDEPGEPDPGENGGEGGEAAAVEPVIVNLGNQILSAGNYMEDGYTESLLVTPSTGWTSRVEGGTVSMGSILEVEGNVVTIPAAKMASIVQEQGQLSMTQEEQQEGCLIRTLTLTNSSGTVVVTKVYQIFATGGGG